MSDNPTACLIIIGNEILSGRTVDANLTHLAQRLGAIGIRMAEARVIPDIEAEIVAAVNQARARYTYVFTTGGIGPTHDDITAASIAAAFGVPLTRHPEAERRLLAYYPPEKVNPARMRMADTPEGALLIDNPVSVAPGFIIGNVHVLPGVPKIMQGMLDGLLATLKGGQPISSRSIVCGSPEGEIAAELGAIQSRWPDVDIGSYPFMNASRPGTTIVFRGTDRMAIDGAAVELLTYTAAIGITTEEGTVA